MVLYERIYKIFTMKICWDNLDKLIYDSKRGIFRKKSAPGMIFTEIEHCEACGESFLGKVYVDKNKPHTNKFCSVGCINKSRSEGKSINKQKYWANHRNKYRSIINAKNRKAYRYDKYRRASRLLQDARRRAKSRNLEYNLDRDWFMNEQCKGCALTGIPFDFINVGSAKVPTIDRIDPTEGYTKENARLVLHIMNYWKSDYSDDELYEVAKAFVRKHDDDRPQ